VWRERRQNDEITRIRRNRDRAARVDVALEEAVWGVVMFQCSDTVDAGHDPQTAVVGSDVLERSAEAQVRWPDGNIRVEQSEAACCAAHVEVSLAA
jgi:hypothetical protein